MMLGAMMILLQAMSRTSVIVRTSKNQGIALSIARSKIETLRSNGYASIPPNGAFYDELLLTLPPLATTTLSVSNYNAKTKQVSVGVVWKDAGMTASSTVSLTTLITETGALP